MWRKMGLVVLGVGLAAGLSACAKDYGIPAGGPHFASWEHFKYSWFEGTKKPDLSKEQLKMAREEGWWGIPIRYNIEDLE